MLKHQPVLLALALAGEQQHRSGEGGLKGKAEVQKEKWIGIPVPYQGKDIEGYPENDQDTLRDEESPRADPGSHPVGNSLAKAGFIVMNDIDRVPVAF